MVRVWRRIKEGMKEFQVVHHTLGFFLYGYLIVFGAIGILALFSAIPGMRIHSFLVNGNSAIATDTVIRTVEETLSSPFAFLVGRDVPIWAPQERIAAAVYALDPHIRNVTVSGRFSRTLSIDVIEETPAMLWCGSDVPSASSTPSDNACWFANKEGVIYAPAPAYLDAPYVRYYTTPVPIFEGPYPRAHEYPSGYVIADATTMHRLSIFFDALPEKGYQVVSLGVTADADVIVSTKEGTQFLFSLSRNISHDMKRLEALQEALRVKDETTPLSQVDLRFETKIYYH